jgi:hypothetical protein
VAAEGVDVVVVEAEAAVVDEVDLHEEVVAASAFEVFLFFFFC